MDHITKRQLLGGVCLASAGILAGMTTREERKKVTAVEDLMRGHGVLRRILLAYSEAASKLRTSPASVPPEALRQAAELFRSFGGEYHERKQEESVIFPALVRPDRGLAGDVGILVVQHQRGRDMTGYVLAQAGKGESRFRSNASELAGVLDSFVRMYRAHAAREDTAIFPAWKRSLALRQYEEAGERFEEIERQQLGGNGFEQAVQQIGDIEARLGLPSLDQFTMAAPG